MEYIFDREEVRFWADQSTEVIWKKDYTTLADAIHKLAGKLLEYMDDRTKNPSVWDGAPEWATSARVRYTDGPLTGHNDMYSQRYDRELPKTKAREIAESQARIWANGTQSLDYQKNLADIIEAAILEAQKDGEK